MHAIRRFMRANPQAVVLLVICLVLGLGTFIVVLIAVGQSGSGTPSGEPSGVLLLASALLG